MTGIMKRPVVHTFLFLLFGSRNEHVRALQTSWNLSFLVYNCNGFPISKIAYNFQLTTNTLKKKTGNTATARFCMTFCMTSYKRHTKCHTKRSFFVLSVFFFNFHSFTINSRQMDPLRCEASQNPLSNLTILSVAILAQAFSC